MNAKKVLNEINQAMRLNEGDMTCMIESEEVGENEHDEYRIYDPSNHFHNYWVLFNDSSLRDSMLPKIKPLFTSGPGVGIYSIDQPHFSDGHPVYKNGYNYSISISLPDRYSTRSDEQKIKELLKQNGITVK
jgi:hypothetical protein